MARTLPPAPTLTCDTFYLWTRSLDLWGLRNRPLWLCLFPGTCRRRGPAWHQRTSPPALTTRYPQLRCRRLPKKKPQGETRAAGTICGNLLQGGLRHHLQVTLVGVEDDRLLSVELSLHFQRQTADGGLEVRLLGVNHQPHSLLHGVLESTGKRLRLGGTLGSWQGSVKWIFDQLYLMLTLAKMSTLCSILFIWLSSSAVNFFSKGSSWPDCKPAQTSHRSAFVFFGTTPPCLNTMKIEAADAHSRGPWVNMHCLPRAFPALRPKCWLVLQHWRLIKYSSRNSISLK